MNASEPDIKGLENAKRGVKIIFWLGFHIITFGIFLIPHALLHYILGGNKR